MIIFRRARDRTVRIRESPIPWRIVCGAVSALVVLSGCVAGAERVPPDRRVPDIKTATTTDGELLARVSAVLRAWPAVRARRGWGNALAYADLHAARDQLGLPADASIFGPGKRRLLLSFAARPLFRFITVIYNDPTLGPLGHVVDAERIEVAVGTSFAFSGPGSTGVYPWDAIVLRTSQPFADIADRLRREGFQEADDGLLVSDRHPPEEGLSREVPFQAAGDAGRGVVVFGGSPRAARAALLGAGTELTPIAALIAELPGVARMASGPTAGGRSGRCVVAIGLGEDAAPREGEVVVVLDEEAQAERLLFSGITYGAAVFGEATAEGNRASVRFESTDKFRPTRIGLENVAVPYDCQ